MKTLLHALLFLAVLAPLPALSAGIDCRRASTEVEKLICADPALIELDRQLNHSYSRLLGKLEAGYHGRVRETQQDWIALRDETVRSRLAEHEKHGLGQLLRARIKQLDGALLEVNSLRFLDLGANRPMFLLTALRGTAAYNGWADREWQKVTADNKAASANLARPACEQDCDSPADTWRVFALGYASPDMISVQETALSYSGGAHPSNEDVYSRWWLVQPGEIHPQEMLAGTAYRKVIVKHVENYLHDNNPRDDHRADPEALKWALKSALNPEHWGLSDDALVIIGQGYDYGMGRGLIEIKVPWAAFGKELNPGLKAALGRHKGAVAQRHD